MNVPFFINRRQQHDTCRNLHSSGTSHFRHRTGNRPFPLPRAVASSVIPGSRNPSARRTSQSCPLPRNTRSDRTQRTKDIFPPASAGRPSVLRYSGMTQCP
jgi:hypothetical protein